MTKRTSSSPGRLLPMTRHLPASTQRQYVTPGPGRYSPSETMMIGARRNVRRQPLHSSIHWAERGAPPSIPVIDQASRCTAESSSRSTRVCCHRASIKTQALPGTIWPPCSCLLRNPPMSH